MAAADFVTGYDHVGIPSNDMEATRRFFEALGFVKVFETDNNGKVIFYACGDVIVETYDKHGEATGKRGAIDHIALRVSDLDATYEELKKTGYPIVEGPAFLNYWENGVRYVVVLGPDAEAVEFSQML